MVSKRLSVRDSAVSRKRLRPKLTLALALGAVGLSVACGGIRRFPLAPVVTEDPDRKSFSPAPEEYVSPFAWDGANQMVFRPASRFLAVDPAGRAKNVNAFDEVPDSSWFENRIGKGTMTPAELTSGPCGDKVLDPNGPPGSWLIDQGKPNGANPGFRVNIPGVGKFMLKVDPDGEPERATGATAIAARLYHAAGYFAPCDSVVYFAPSVLALKPGLEVTDNSGVSKKFDQAMLDKVLSGASKRNGLLRMVASRWLPGKPIGPYRYEGTRDDDPNDVVPHEDRRELRGGRLLAAWLNHFDSREQNTMDVFLQDDPKDKSPNAKGHVRHYILDMGDCFGSVWAADGISRRLGHAYYLDLGYVAEDFVTLGIPSRPWDRAKRDGGIFNYFSVRDFDAEAWHGGYPNPAFVRMTEADGAWMARIVARFDDGLVSTAVAAGKYDEPSTAYLTHALMVRRDLLLRRYLTKLSPLTDVSVRGDLLCATDLARKTHVAADKPGGEVALLYSGADAEPKLQLRPSRAGESGVCVELVHTVTSRDLPDADPGRYVVVDLFTASAKYPLRVHAYDLGQSRGFRVVGLERLESMRP